MKKLFLIFCITFLFYSCSNVTEVEEVTPERETLKELLITKEADISWTKGLEEERLTTSISIDEKNISDTIGITPEVASIVYKNEEPVFPSLKGFSSLDLSLLEPYIQSIVDDFCRAVSVDIYQGPESYFDANFIFNFVFFRNDLIEGWKERFGTDFPVKSPKELEEDAVKDKNKSQDKKIEKQTPLFEKWIIGSPFIGDEIIHLPVRFYCQQGSVDVTLYINLNNNKIYQITEGTYD